MLIYLILLSIGCSSLNAGGTTNNTNEDVVRSILDTPIALKTIDIVNVKSIEEFNSIVFSLDFPKKESDDPIDTANNTLMHVMINPELIKSDSELSKLDKDTRVEMMKILVSEGTSFNELNSNGDKPVDLLKTRGFNDFVNEAKELLNGLEEQYIALSSVKTSFDSIKAELLNANNFSISSTIGDTENATLLKKAAVEQKFLILLNMLSDKLNSESDSIKSIADIRDDSGNTPLHILAKIEEDTSNLMSYAMNLGFDPREANNDNKTVLQLAVNSDQPKTVEFIVNKTNVFDEGSFYLAVRVNNRSLVNTFLDKMLARDSDISSTDVQRILKHEFSSDDFATDSLDDIVGRKIFHLAILNNDDTATRIINAIDDDICEDKVNGSYPIHLAVSVGNISAVNALITKGALIDVLDGEFNTPLQLAVLSKTFSMINLTYSMSDLLYSDDLVNQAYVQGEHMGRTPLMVAMLTSPSETAAILLKASNMKNTILTSKSNHTGDNLNTALVLAINNSYKETIVEYVSFVSTVLTDLIGDISFIKYFLSQNKIDLLVDVVSSILVQDGSNINNIGNISNILHLAIKDLEYGLILRLLALPNSQALANAENEEHKIPLIEAMSIQDSSSEYMQMLTLLITSTNGALLISLSDDDLDKQTLIQYGIRKELRKEILDLILAMPNLDLTHLDKDGKTALQLAIDLKNQDISLGILTATSTFDENAFYASLMNKSTLVLNSLLDILLETIPILDIQRILQHQYTDGKKVIHFAINNNDGTAIRIINAVDTLYDIVNDLLDSSYPIHLAVAIGDVKVVDALLKKGASKTVLDGNENTPLQLAILSNTFSASVTDPIKKMSTLLYSDDLVNQRYTKGSNRGRTPLMVAVLNSAAETSALLNVISASKLSEVLADTSNSTSDSNKNAIMLAISKVNNSDVISAIANAVPDKLVNLDILSYLVSENRIEFLINLVSSNSSLNNPNEGSNILHEASRSFFTLHSVIKELLKLDFASRLANKLDSDGKTPLIVAMECIKNRVSGVNIYSQDMIDIMDTLVSVTSGTILIPADKDDNVKQTMLQYGIRNSFSIQNIIKLFTLSNLDINHKDKNGDTALFIAIQNSLDIELGITAFSGLDKNLKNGNNETAFHLKWRQIEALSLSNPSIFRVTTTKDNLLNALNTLKTVENRVMPFSDGKTPLIRAIEFDNDTFNFFPILGLSDIEKNRGSIPIPGAVYTASMLSQNANLVLAYGSNLTNPNESTVLLTPLQYAVYMEKGGKSGTTTFELATADNIRTPFNGTIMVNRSTKNGPNSSKTFILKDKSVVALAIYKGNSDVWKYLILSRGTSLGDGARFNPNYVSDKDAPVTENNKTNLLHEAIRASAGAENSGNFLSIVLDLVKWIQINLDATDDQGNTAANLAIQVRANSYVADYCANPSRYSVR